MPAAGGAATPGPLAEWPDRVVAALIDGAIVVAAYIVVFIVGAILGAVSDILGTLVVTIGYLALSVYWLYVGYMEGQVGQSPAKRLTGLKVVKEADGSLLGGGMGIVRKIAHALDGICFIGYLFPLWDPKKQTFADKIMTTVVIKGIDKRKFSMEIFKP
jgi:uncharacterized RDD family membrane protein YckC